MNLIEAYVDGSWMAGRVGWATVILKGGKLYGEFSGALDDEEVQGTRQVAGELKAVEQTLYWCVEQDIKEITIYYDYAGVKEWVTGAWKAKLPLTQKYRDYVRSLDVKISWVKVKSHSGVKYNEMADKLAKKVISD